MKNSKKFYASLCLLTSFALWTLIVRFADVRPIGPQESPIGLAALNRAVHSLTGVHMSLYTVTDLLSIVPFLVVFGFAILGLVQWIRRKSLFKVDPDIMALGGFYIAVAAAFVFFEIVVVNHRPVLIEGVLEASYPSSTTMLVMCVMPTAMIQLRRRIRNIPLRRCTLSVIAVFTAFMVIGRLISGVHWITDIIGGALLSAGLVTMYGFVTEKTNK